MQHPLPAKIGTNLPTSGGRLVGIIRLRTKATEFFFCLVLILYVTFVIDIETYQSLYLTTVWKDAAADDIKLQHNHLLSQAVRQEVTRRSFPYFCTSWIISLMFANSSVNLSFSDHECHILSMLFA
jgi:hypothetical protein